MMSLWTHGRHRVPRKTQLPSHTLSRFMSSRNAYPAPLTYAQLNFSKVVKNCLVANILDIASGDLRSAKRKLA